MHFSYLTVCLLTPYVACSTAEHECTVGDADDTALLQHTTLVHHGGTHMAHRFQLLQGNPRASLPLEVPQDSLRNVIDEPQDQKSRKWRLKETNGTSKDTNDGPKVDEKTEVTTKTENSTHHIHQAAAWNASKGEYRHDLVKADRKMKKTQTRIASEVYVQVWFALLLILLWAVSYSCPDIKWLQMAILPITLCTFLIAQDLANQSLVFITKSPFGITACQSLFMTVVAAAWCVRVERPNLQDSGLRVYAPWLTVAALFALYQMSAHIVSARCSLSERTVFSNMIPAVTVVVETFVMPAGCKPYVNVSTGLALFMLVVGAVMFISGPHEEETPSELADAVSVGEYTAEGTLVAVLMVAIAVPYRLSERYQLWAGKSIRLGVLLFIDGIGAAAFCTLLAFYEEEGLMNNLLFWLQHPWLFVLFIFSCVAFLGSHVCAMLLLRTNTTTAYVVFLSLVGFLEVACGVFLYDDPILRDPRACIGLSVSLGSGLWYSIEEASAAEDTLAPKSDAPEEEVAECRG